LWALGGNNEVQYVIVGKLGPGMAHQVNRRDLAIYYNYDILRIH